MHERALRNTASSPVAMRLASMAALPSLLVGPVSAGDLKSLTTPQELVLGQVFAEQVDAQFPLLHDPVVT